MKDGVQDGLQELLLERDAERTRIAKRLSDIHNRRRQTEYVIQNYFNKIAALENRTEDVVASTTEENIVESFLEYKTAKKLEANGTIQRLVDRHYASIEQAQQTYQKLNTEAEKVSRQLERHQDEYVSLEMAIAARDPNLAYMSEVREELGQIREQCQDYKSQLAMVERMLEKAELAYKAADSEEALKEAKTTLDEVRGTMRQITFQIRDSNKLYAETKTEEDFAVTSLQPMYKPN